MIRDIVKYMSSSDILQSIDDKDIYEYLIPIHYPWLMNEHTDPIILYRQGYLSTLNMADPYYQKIYDSYIEPILMNKIQILLWQRRVSDYDTLYRYVRKDPKLVRDILTDNITIDILLRSMELNI